MTPDQILVTVVGLAAAAGVAWLYSFKRTARLRASTASVGCQEQMILVKGGYTPDTIRVAAGRPVRLLSRREETVPDGDAPGPDHRGARVMATPPRLELLESDDQPAGHCVVCGIEIPAGEGVTASYKGRTLRFRCPGCFVRFELNPVRYLAGQEQPCCGGTHDHSPASEWRCD